MDETTIRVAIRATARISFVLFLGAFLGDALYRLMPAAVRCAPTQVDSLSQMVVSV